MFEALRAVFEKAIGDTLGDSAKEAIIFHLRKRLGRCSGKTQLPFTKNWKRYSAVAQFFSSNYSSMNLTKI